MRDYMNLPITSRKQSRYALANTLKILLSFGWGGKMVIGKIKDRSLVVTFLAAKMYGN